MVEVTLRQMLMSLRRARAARGALGLLALGLVLATGGAATLAAQGAAAAAAASGKGFIWTIERGGKTGWLVGSLHLLPQDAYPLPASMDAAFQAAEVLVEEADPDELSAPATAAEVLKRAFFPPGQTLEGSVSPATFKILSERAAQAGVPVQVLQQMRPWMVAVTLAALEMQKSGFDPALGLDRHFRDRARAASKPLRTVETAMEQIGMLESLGPALQDALVVEALRGASSEVSQARSLFAAWKAGDGPQPREDPGGRDQGLAGDLQGALRRTEPPLDAEDRGLPRGRPVHDRRGSGPPGGSRRSHLAPARARLHRGTALSARRLPG